MRKRIWRSFSHARSQSSEVLRFLGARRRFAAMPQPRRRQQTYDHRLRELVRRTGDIEIATRLGVPRSTAMGWSSGRSRPGVTLDVLDEPSSELRDEVLRLRRRVRILNAVVGLLVAHRKDRTPVTAVRGRSREPSRARLIAAVQRARKVLPLRSALRVIGVSTSTYNSWTAKPEPCGLDPDRSCPRSRPDRLTNAEVCAIHAMATDEKFRHVPTGRLAVLAARLGRVHASSTTWYRIVRSRGWERSRHRRHPVTPRVGVRATLPDQVWHIDTSVVRLVDGTKVWIHAVIDNFSRKILAWRVSERFDITNAVAVLGEAVDGAVSKQPPPTLVADGGVENFNSEVDGFVTGGCLSRVRALVDVRFSNSMIESFWNNMKHQWLFQHRLETAAVVRWHFGFYVGEYNQVIPHAAFVGQTPDEMYYGRGAGVGRDLARAREEARRRRLAENRGVSCARCEDPCGRGALAA